ncbi:phage portal protein [Brevundimonas subvibrioides]|uniref:Phage portal protein, lambda family n=1 Tax=Brevundimonas subvibrioides (strain ATCC 15264 / DSM 4735 / LMG 14903 / NBRC 16000 / CB 81) TaxID=633149 RepID=D9QFX7_BRESC|nr:phage portal protein [Brevundimonas subvibrioides]ADL00691.1 phage portal protein, lambda family [Brevundimonas subvibrioides ATCC 15264]
MTLLDATGRPISSSHKPRANALAGGFDFGSYDSGGACGPIMADWFAQIRSADMEWLPNRNPSVARARDVVRNDPIGASAVARRQNAAIGRGWRLSARPNARALGIDPIVARELGAAMEVEFRSHAYGHAFEIDAERRLNFGQLLRVTTAHLMVDGDGPALVEWAEGEGTRYSTRLRLVDPDRLSNPTGRMDDRYLRGGIERNEVGVPVRYWFRERHPADLGVDGRRFTWTGYDRFTAWGRPQVLHAFDPQRAEQTRGVSRFAASLKSFRSLAKFSDATLQAATINALMVAFVKSSAGPEAVSEFLEVDDLKGFETSRESFYESNPVSLAGGARMPVLPFGDEIEMQTASRDVASFDAFVRANIRLIAASLGVTYEELSMDYSQTNYSSARAAMVHAWAETQSLSSIVEAQIVRPYYVAFLEEAFDRGYLSMPAGAPDFYDAVDAYAEAKWIGPGRGYIDPVKEIDAAAARIEAGLSTLEDECADQGKDWEEVLDQQARERQRRIDLKLPDPAAPPETAPLTQTEAEDAANARPGALARVRSTARSPEHAAFLDQRSGA